MSVLMETISVDLVVLSLATELCLLVQEMVCFCCLFSFGMEIVVGILNSLIYITFKESLMVIA